MLTAVLVFFSSHNLPGREWQNRLYGPRLTCPVAGLNLIQPLFFLSWEDRRRHPVQNSKYNKVVYPIYDSRPPKPSLFRSSYYSRHRPSDPNNGCEGDYPKPYPVGRYIPV